MPEPQSPRPVIVKIVSGGQTGVDRGALDAAIALGVPHGGWCPRGRAAEDGRIPDRYQLEETESAEYVTRTERNVLDSDGTLLLSRGPVRGGTRQTRELAIQHGKPHLLVCFDESASMDAVLEWLEANDVRTLNVAGPRQSNLPGIAAEAEALVRRVLEACQLGE